MRYLQPQNAPIRVDRSNPLAIGLTGAFTPGDGNALRVGNALTRIGQGGIGYGANAASDYWQASPTSLVSAYQTWTVLAILDGSVASSGATIFAERPNGTQILKVLVGQFGGNGAGLVLRDAGGAGIIQTDGTIDIRSGGPRSVVVTRRASNDHRIYAKGVYDNGSTTTVPANFGPSAAVICVDPQDSTSTFNQGQIPLILCWSRSLSDVEIASISANPWQIFASDDNTDWLRSATATLPSAALAWLEQNDTIAIAATVTNTATLGWTESSDTTAITAAVITQATLGWTEASDTSAIAVTVNTGGAVINWTEQPDTYAIVVSVPTWATLGWIEANDVTAITATAITPATATINWTEQNDTCAIIAAAVVNGGLAWTEQNDVTSITAVYAQLVTATLAWMEQSDIAGTSTFNEYFFTIMRQSIVNNSGSISNAPINRIGTFV